MDLQITDKKSQKGSKCIDKQKNKILQYYKNLSANTNIKKKDVLCNDLEILFRRKKDNNTKWFLNL